MNQRTDAQGEALDANTETRPDASTEQPNTAPVAAQGGETPATPTTVDPDEAELAAAREALAAEQAAKDGTTPAQPAAGTPPTQTTTTTAEAAAPNATGNQPPRMVPLDALHAERQQRQRAQQEADYLRGQVDALRAMGTQGTASPGPAAPAAPAAPADPIQAEIDAQNAAVLALAERADLGEITFSELERGRIAAQARIAELTAQRVLQTVAPPPQVSLADEAIIQAHEQRLYAAYPYAAALSPQQAQFLAQIAAAEAAADGKPYGTGPAEDMRLKAAVAELSSTFGPRWGLKPVQQQQTTQPAPQGQAPLSPKARAAMAKMDLAAGLPPDTREIGSSSSSIDLSSASIEAMDEEAIAALPAATRQRILGHATG